MKKVLMALFAFLTVGLLAGMALAVNDANSVNVIGTFERAGNVTELTILGNTVTQTWQGYFGNVSGTIELVDASVFASILEDGALGFDNAEHDFEVLVLEDGHGVDTSLVTYYFFIELE